MPGNDPFTTGVMHNPPYALSSSSNQNFLCLLLALGVLPHVLLPSNGIWSSPSSITVEDATRLREKVWGEEGCISWQSQLRFGHSRSTLGPSLCFTHPYSHALTPYRLPHRHHSIWYAAGTSTTMGPSSFLLLFPPQCPTTKIYYHSGPLWINDLLSALFIRAWGGSRSLCVWRWGRLELCSS